MRKFVLAAVVATSALGLAACGETAEQAGETVDAISRNITVGLADRGMPGFAELLTEKKIESLSKYILSQRQGWDTVNFNIYSVEENSQPDLTLLDSASPVVSGQFQNGIADLCPLGRGCRPAERRSGLDKRQ